MTKGEIDAVLDRVKTWPEDRQLEAVTLLRDMEELASGTYCLSDEERKDIRDGMAEAARGEFASDARVEGILTRQR